MLQLNVLISVVKLFYGYYSHVQCSEFLPMLLEYRKYLSTVMRLDRKSSQVQSVFSVVSSSMVLNIVNIFMCDSSVNI